MSNHPARRRTAGFFWLSLAAAAAAAAPARANERDGPSRHHRDLPQLGAAQPGHLVGSCESLAERLAGLANTTITSASLIAAGVLKQAGVPIAEHCRVAGRMA